MIALNFIIIAGDVELNPGPSQLIPKYCLSILHQNIRSIRNKLDYIENNFSDFHILCFTETHLSDIILNESLSIPGFTTMYRKDNTAHSGGFLTYVTSQLHTNRITVLEDILPESLWISIRTRTDTYIVGSLYRSPNSTNEFWDKLNVCLENAFDISNKVLVLGDVNEDQLNPRNHKFKDILTVNDLHNVINEPTRVSNHSSTLLDPIAISNNIVAFNSGIFPTSNDISDHFGTYAHIQCSGSTSMPFKRRVWNYKRADFVKLNELITVTDWSFLHSESIHIASEAFSKQILELATECIPSNFVTIRPNDRPWYDSIIRRSSRQRDRQKEKSLTSNKLSDWNVYKCIEIKLII